MKSKHASYVPITEHGVTKTYPVNRKAIRASIKTSAMKAGSKKAGTKRLRTENEEKEKMVADAKRRKKARKKEKILARLGSFFSRAKTKDWAGKVFKAPE